MPPGPEAWHEAGHAYAAHLLGGFVREVSLESEYDEHEGHVSVEWCSPNDPDLSRRSAMVALAGPVAELVFRGQDILEDPEALSAWRGDWDEAQDQLEQLHSEPEAREKAKLAILTELRAHFEDPQSYEALARIADALDAHVTLDRELFERAIGSWRA